MLTRQCKDVLKNIKKITENTEQDFSYMYNSTCFCLDNDFSKTYDYKLYDSEIGGIITLLVQEGYIEPSYNKYTFKLTQRGIHNKQLTYAAIGKFLLHNIIAIIALLVSVIGLLSDLGLIAIELT